MTDLISRLKNVVYYIFNIYIQYLDVAAFVRIYCIFVISVLLICVLKNIQLKDYFSILLSENYLLDLFRNGKSIPRAIHPYHPHNYLTQNGYEQKATFTKSTGGVFTELWFKRHISCG